MTRLSTTKREALYEAEADKARERGLGNHPVCNLCSLAIVPGQKWDVSHEKHKPKWLGGAVDGISHRRCNRLWNHRHDTPLFAKTARQRQKHIGAFRTTRPMIGSRESNIKLRIGGGRPIDRRTGREL